MRDLIERALSNHQEETGDSRPVPDPAVVCIPTEEGMLFAPERDIEMLEDGDTMVDAGRHCISDVVVDVEEVR